MDADTVEETLCEVHDQLVSRLPGASRPRIGGLHVTLTGLPFPPMNKAAAARLDDADVGAAVEASLAAFARADVPFFWWITPASRPTRLRDELTARGLRPVATYAAMAAPVDEIRQAPWPKELDVQPVESEKDREDFLLAFGEGFDMPLEAWAPWRHLFAHAFPRDGRGSLVPLVGRVGGEPATSGVVFVGSRAMAIHSVATRPPYRRRGFAAAMTRAAVQEGRARGAQVATLESTLPAETIYRALGLRDVGAFEAWSR